MGANAVERTPENITAFKQAASEQLRNAAKVISESGFSEQAVKLEGLADFTKPEVKSAFTPYQILGNMAGDMTSENNFRTDLESLRTHNLDSKSFSFDNVNDAVNHEAALHKIAKILKPSGGETPSVSLDND